MKQTFRIPEGCDKVTFEQIGNQIITTFESNPTEFKKGDIVLITHPDENGYLIAFYTKIRGNNVTSGLGTKGDLVINGIGIQYNAKIKLANPQQRQLLLDKLESEGWKYNEEKCELERIKWVPKEGESY